MTITKSNTYTTTDGATHATHKEAKLHQDVIDRTKRVLNVLLADESALADISGANDAEDVAREIAKLGVEMLAALTLPSTRGPKPKVATA